MFILHVYTQPSLVEEGRLLQVFMMFHFFSCATRDDIFTCAQKLTYVILIHRTEPTTKTWEKKDMLRSIGKQSMESVESVLEKKRKATVGRICRKVRE